MAERRNDEVMDMVDGRTHASWVKAGGTNNLQICSSTNDFDQARGLCSKRAKCASEDTTKVQILYIYSSGCLGAVSCSRRSIHVVQQLLELDGGVERIWLTSRHRRGLLGQRS